MSSGDPQRGTRRPQLHSKVLKVEGYLQSDPDPLGQSPFWKYRLHLRDNGAAQDAPFRPNQVTVLLDARHNSKELWEIPGDDAANALPFQLLGGVQGCRKRAERDVREEESPEGGSLARRH